MTRRGDSAGADERPASSPAPLAPGDAALFHAALASHGDVRRALEDLLEALPRERSDPLMLLLREGRASWLMDLNTVAGSVLVCGNALSGAVVALARAGFAVTVADPCAERLALAAARVPELVPRGARSLTIVRADASALPFADAAFDVVIGAEDVTAPALAAYRRVARAEVLVVAENRLAYKRSAGRRGAYHVPSPFDFLRRALWPATHARTLGGHVRALAAAPTWSVARALALYPHQAEFAQLVGLRGGRGPQLFVGPRERENRPKVVAQALGLFPWLTPSFALIARRAATRGRKETPGRWTRAERVLAALAERLGEDVPEIEHAIATRGNALLWQTRPRSGAGAQRSSPEAGAPRDGPWTDPRGRWVVKLPLGLHRERLAERHAQRLELLRRRFPSLPLPEPLFAGHLSGVFVTCERRLPGLSAAQAPERAAPWGRTLEDAARQLAGLVVERERVLDEPTLAVLVDEKHALVARHVRDAATRGRLATLVAEARERLFGRSVPLVLQHADLRPKHVQVDRAGRILAYLDWGSSTLCDLPYFDLLHLVGQHRKQAEDATPGRAWEVVRDPRSWQPAERAALDAYAGSLGIDGPTRRALERLYPLLVAAQAERTWDYSRPGWFQAHFFASGTRPRGV